MKPQINHHMVQLKNVLRACQQIKTLHNIEVYNLFNIYLHNDDRINYNENLCHTIIKNNSNSNCGDLKQCSKYCKNDTGKKKGFYCQQHYNKSCTGLLDSFIIPPDILKAITKLQTATGGQDAEPSAIVGSASKKSGKGNQKKTLKQITIDGRVYFINQTCLTVYDMDMGEVGKYGGMDDEERHIICENGD